LERARYYPLVPPYDAEPAPRRLFDSCALVSNGGELLGSGCGATIDSNNAVFRANSPQLAGYEADVGARTTHRVLNNIETIRFAWTDPAFEGAFTISMLAPAVAHHKSFIAKARSSRGVERVWQATQAYREDVRHMWRMYNATRRETSGLTSLAHAASTCRVINMFGFGPQRPPPSKHARGGTLYHFWDPSLGVEMQGLDLHDFALEQRIFDEFAWGRTSGICVREPPEEPIIADVERLRGALRAKDRLAKQMRRARRARNGGKVAS
jgi:hypothetical protein